MNNNEDEIVVASAYMTPNTYYIYRDNGMQVVVTLVDGFIESSNKLRQEERDYFKKWYSKNRN